MMTNEQRAERAHRLVLVYQQRHDANQPLETVAADLLCDLMHFCDEYGIDWAYVESTAEMHHNAESAKSGTVRAVGLGGDPARFGYHLGDDGVWRDFA